MLGASILMPAPVDTFLIGPSVTDLSGSAAGAVVLGAAAPSSSSSSDDLFEVESHELFRLIDREDGRMKCIFSFKDHEDIGTAGVGFRRIGDGFKGTKI